MQGGEQWFRKGFLEFVCWALQGIKCVFGRGRGGMREERHPTDCTAYRDRLLHGGWRKGASYNSQYARFKGGIEQKLVACLGKGFGDVSQGQTTVDLFSP